MASDHTPSARVSRRALMGAGLAGAALLPLASRPPRRRGPSGPGGRAGRAAGRRPRAYARRLAHLAPGLARRAPPRRPRRAHPGGDRRGRRGPDQSVRRDGGGHRALGQRPGGHPLVEPGGGGLRRVRDRRDAPGPLHGHLPHRPARRRDRGLGRPGRPRPAQPGRDQRRDHPRGRGRPGRSRRSPPSTPRSRARRRRCSPTCCPTRPPAASTRSPTEAAESRIAAGRRLPQRRRGRARAGPGGRREGGRPRQGRRLRRRVGPGDQADRPRLLGADAAGVRRDAAQPAGRLLEDLGA